MTCKDCIKHNRCFERRGICKDFDTKQAKMERIARNIEMLNQKGRDAKTDQRAYTGISHEGKAKDHD